MDVTMETSGYVYVIIEYDDDTGSPCDIVSIWNNMSDAEAVCESMNYPHSHDRYFVEQYSVHFLT